MGIEQEQRNREWIEALENEDLGFLKRFLLVSGSLKDLAKAYGVSYPTVRLRLDRLIQKVKVSDEFHSQEIGPFERQLRLLLADGALDPETFRKLRDAHLEETKTHPPTES
ncbi:MAG: DUF2089 family protein [Verrucomicrobiales bacterium]|nr:DUF2089 family protein [Verrucomicrobiales bacterium]